MLKFFSKIVIFCFLASAVVACKSAKEDDDTIIPADQLYQEAEELMGNKKYKEAAEKFAKIYYQHPGSDYAIQAEMQEAIALYEAAEYEEAVDACEHFIKMHPLNSDVGFIYHLKALSYYDQIIGVQKDQGVTEKAEEALIEVTKRFPNTKYASDASLKLDLVRDHLAGKENAIGVYYLKQNNPIAAIPRFQNVIQKYQTTSHVPEALHRLVESCLKLGLKDEAKKYAAVLGHNYRDSKWYKYSYNLLKSEHVN